MATVRPKVMKPVTMPDHQGVVETVDIPDECFKSRIEVLEVIPEEDQTAKLTEADVIVSGGRGLRKGENFALIQELARLINGAVGASRGAVEEGWIPPSHQVGSDGPNRCPQPLHGRRHRRRHPAHRGHAGLQDHRGREQGPARTDLRCRNLRRNCGSL